jgi:hypothetical protein
MPRDIPENYTPDMFDAIISALDEERVRLMAVRELMRSLEIEKIPVKNSITMKKRGLPILTSFVQAAIDAVRDYRLEAK